MVGGIPAWLGPLAAALLVSGLDDLVIDAAWLYFWVDAKLLPKAPLWPPGAKQLDLAPRLSIAIMVPLWQEDAVIARMLEHNVGSIRYADYHIFAGAYPNDDATQNAVRGVAERFANVHLALVAHDGPTSKADCLNAIYRQIGWYERRTGSRFDVILVHDAEDVIHPDELRWVNYYAARYDFIQTPVLALPTPLRQITHGIYCDEFAENHTRDMAVRPRLGGFVPSAGVGTAYRRAALEKLAETRRDRIFEPDALTEDYQNGLQLFRLGCSQAFVPVVRSRGGGFLATREYFPQTWTAALRQRTRWVTGIALQSWEKFGWGRNAGETYWLWRDRKGLIASPLGFLSNLLFVYGVATHLWQRAAPVAGRMAMATAALAAIRLGVRMGCTGRVYGLRFALGVPVRAVCANALNAAAAVRSVAGYAIARARRERLAWMKTDHAFPSGAALAGGRRRIGEILVSSGWITQAALSAAMARKPADVRTGEHLVRLRLIDDASLYRALSLQQGVPVAEVGEIPAPVARALPLGAIREWRVLPFRVTDGSFYVATPEVPSERMEKGLGEFTRLKLRFHLVTPARFEELQRSLVC
jgi:adsorption protein B